MSNLKKNFAYHTIWKVFSMILPLVTSPILARQLGAEGVGIYSYISTILGYFSLAANLGIYKYGIREIAAVKGNQDEINRTFWGIWDLHKKISILVGIVYAVYVILWAEYPLYCAVIFLSYIGDTLSLNWLFFGMEDFKRVTIRDCTIKSMSFIFIVLLVRSPNALLKYTALMSVCALVGGLMYWFMYKRYISRRDFSDKRTIVHLKGMMILFVPILMESLYANMDKIMLGVMYSKTEVGYYENAGKALIAKTLVLSIMTVLMPRMASLLANHEKNEFDRMMKKSVSVVMLLVSAFSFGTAAIANEFSILFWGEEFSPCGILIEVMALSMPGQLLANVIRDQYLVPARRDRAYLTSAFVGTVSNFILNMLMIPMCGALGAAVATLISEYIVWIVQMITIRKEINFMRYLRGNYFYLLFGLVMFVSLTWIGQWVEGYLIKIAVKVFAGAVIYIALCSVYWKIIGDRYYFELARNFMTRMRVKR